MAKINWNKVRVNKQMRKSNEDSYLKKQTKNNAKRKFKLASPKQVEFVESILGKKLNNRLTAKDAQSIISDYKLKKSGILSWNTPYKNVN